MKIVYKCAMFLLTFFAGVISPAAFNPNEKQLIGNILPGSSNEEKKALNAAFLQAARKGDFAEVKSLVEQGADIHAKDEAGDQPPLDYTGYTALHYAAEEGHHLVAKYLLSQGASDEMRNIHGITPLALAWGNNYEDIVVAMTGLSLVRDKDDNIVPKIIPRTYEIPRWKKSLCCGYERPMANGVFYGAAEDVAARMGVFPVFFYQGTFACPMSSDIGLNNIGFPTVFLPEDDEEMDNVLRDLRYKVRTFEGRQFKRVLYHEIAHLKLKHVTKRLKVKASAYSLLGLTQEMEAELAALYYLFMHDKQAYFPRNYKDMESSHPTTNEHHRYIAHLYARLLANPATDFPVVTELAERYRQEKSGELPPIEDIVEVVKQQIGEPQLPGR